MLPIAGNACEHITAVVVAAKNKMDLSMGIAIGSSLQVRGCPPGSSLPPPQRCVPPTARRWQGTCSCTCFVPPFHGRLLLPVPRTASPAVPPPPPQIALFAIPLLVLVGWGIGQVRGSGVHMASLAAPACAMFSSPSCHTTLTVPRLPHAHPLPAHHALPPPAPACLQPMSLDYDLFSVTALILSVMQAAQVTADAQSHWLMGVQLVALYVLIGMVYWWVGRGARGQCWACVLGVQQGVQHVPTHANAAE